MTPLKQWTDWQWQLANTVKTAEQLKQYTKLTLAQIKTIQTSDQMRLTPYLLSLINFKNPQDPIALQHIPNAEEKAPDIFSYSQIWEKPEDFLDGENRLLQQKYPDIAVLRIANTCQSFCRFCFEKERTLRHGVPTFAGKKQFAQAVAIIRAKKEIRQILLSGGDPSILPDKVLQKYLEPLLQIPQLKIIRINTRTLLHNPFRITPTFAKMLGDLQRKSWKGNLQHGEFIHVGIHFNHPHEITPEALTAMRTLQSEGIHLYNQTVLLKGINDSAPILQQLFRTLLNEGVQLHYLSHAMAVPGTSHFRTTVRKGVELLDELRKTGKFRGQLPHYEMSHESGKQIVTALSPTFIKAGTRQKPIIKFISDITEKWESYPDGNDEP